MNSGLSTSVKTQRQSMKTNILSDSELLGILENGTFSSDEDFGLDSNDDIDDFLDDDFDVNDLIETGNLSDENEIINVNNRRR